jgi:hypothetical protein
LSYSITNPGSNYAVGDFIVSRKGTNTANSSGESYSVGMLSVDGNGAITGITWTTRAFEIFPTGEVISTTLPTTDTTNTGDSRNPGKTGSGISAIYSNTGSGASIKLSPDQSTQIKNGSGVITQDGFSTSTVTNGTLTAHDGYLKVDISNHVYINHLDTTGSRSWPENFVGPFTRFDGPTNDGTMVKGWTFPVDHTNRQTLFASIDAVFTPKPGGSLALAGAGHLVTV